MLLVIFDEIHKHDNWKNYLKGVYDKFHGQYQFLVSGSGRLDDPVNVPSFKNELWDIWDRKEEVDFLITENNYQKSFSNVVQSEYADALSKTVSELKVTEQQLHEAEIDIIHRLVLAAEKDQDTGDHIVRMSHYSSLIAEKLGLEAKDIRKVFPEITSPWWAE